MAGIQSTPQMGDDSLKIVDLVVRLTGLHMYTHTHDAE